MVKHAELIKECLDLMRGRKIKFVKVKSHVGVYKNELADRLAAEATVRDKTSSKMDFKRIEMLNPVRI